MSKNDPVVLPMFSDEDLAVLVKSKSITPNEEMVAKFRRAAGAMGVVDSTTRKYLKFKAAKEAHDKAQQQKEQNNL